MKKLILLFIVLVVAGVYWFSTQSVVSPTHPLIRVISPVAGEKITSPLTVTGEARGTWYFEASFPVKLTDEAGNVLAIAPAQAQGEWMTEEFVPFSVQLTFTPPASEKGFLVLEKDNPSGLPENDDSFSLPIRFAN